MFPAGLAVQVAGLSGREEDAIEDGLFDLERALCSWQQSSFKLMQQTCGVISIGRFWISILSTASSLQLIWIPVRVAPGCGSAVADRRL
jgi:hypothetical protein